MENSNLKYCPRCWKVIEDEVSSKCSHCGVVFSEFRKKIFIRELKTTLKIIADTGLEEADSALAELAAKHPFHKKDCDNIKAAINDALTKIKNKQYDEAVKKLELIETKLYVLKPATQKEIRAAQIADEIQKKKLKQAEARAKTKEKIRETTSNAKEKIKETIKDLPKDKITVENFQDTITNIAGVSKINGFNIKEFFQEVFKKHSSEEIEEYFIVGTQTTTPKIEDINTNWPKPWMFFKVLFSTLILYFFFLMAWHYFSNRNLLPGILLIGSFAVPIATVILFFEVNARKNVSLYQVFKLIAVGGVFGLIISLTLSTLSSVIGLGWLANACAGIVEEPAKIIVVLLFVNMSKYRYTLNGLLFGAASGAGFAAFESAGYAMRIGILDYGSSEVMTDVTILRALLTPFGHIVWTAMCCAALWKVKGDKKFNSSMLRDFRFQRIFWIAVALHFIWNMPLYLPFYCKYLILGLIGWIIIIAFIQDGLKQIYHEKINYQEHEITEIEDSSEKELPEYTTQTT